MTDWVLARLQRATADHAAAADTTRMSLAGLPSNRALYIECLLRIYGFEAPIESAFLMTAGLSDVIDLRSRRRTRLLRADLRGLGIASTRDVEVFRSVAAFASPCEALGWMYVVDRSALLHGVLQRHVAQLPNELATATSYLTNGGRGAGPRLRDLGVALDEIVQTPEMTDQVIEAATKAFDEERRWFDYARFGSRAASLV